MYLRPHRGEGDYLPWAGIKVEPLGDDNREVKIVYAGLLAKSGADHVYLHTGFGKRRSWEYPYDHLMEQTARGWEKTIMLERNHNQLNFCFKDCADNWDNNKGENWTYAVTD